MNSIETRLECALDCLHGLSVGDAFGECFFGSPDIVAARIATRELPKPPWRYTDDTEMAIAILETLARLGRIDQDALSARFVKPRSTGKRVI